MIRLILISIIILLFVIYSIFDAIFCFILEKLFNKKELVRTHNNKVVRFVLKAFIFVSGVSVIVKGKENIDESETMFIISSHRGFFDIIVGDTLFNTPVGFVAKNNLEKIPFISYWMKKIDCIFLDRKDIRSGVKMVIDAIQKINDGVNIWLCPEGTRNKNEDPLELLPFKAGAFKIPEKANCKILPIAILGTDDIFEKHIPLIKKGTVKVNIGKAFYINDLSENERLTIDEHCKNLIKNLMEELVKNV